MVGFLPYLMLSLCKSIWVLRRGVSNVFIAFLDTLVHMALSLLVRIGLVGADIEWRRGCQRMLLIGCARKFVEAWGAQCAWFFRTTDRDCFESLACGKGGGRSRARAKVINTLCKVELIRRRTSWVRYWRSSPLWRLRLQQLILLG